MTEKKYRKRKPIPAKLLWDPRCFLGFGFGTGLSPIAPGTLGTLAGLPLYYLLSDLDPLAYGALVALLFAAGIHFCQHCEDRLDSQDHSGIVWDEIVGYLVTMAAIPFSWKAAAIGFVLFRLFDILKPWPISLLDRRVHGGLGIMLDDALAGIFAAICMRLLLPWVG